MLTTLKGTSRNKTARAGTRAAGATGNPAKTGVHAGASAWKRRQQ